MQIVSAPPRTDDPALDLWLQRLRDVVNSGVIHVIQCQPVGFSDKLLTPSAHGTHRVDILAAGDSCYFEFLAPFYFKEIRTAYVYYIPTVNGTFDWTVTTSGGAVGEDEASNADTATGDGVAATNDEIGRVDCSSAFTNVRENDLIGVQFTIDALAGGTLGINAALFVFEYYEAIIQ